MLSFNYSQSEELNGNETEIKDQWCSEKFQEVVWKYAISTFFGAVLHPQGLTRKIWRLKFLHYIYSVEQY